MSASPTITGPALRQYRRALGMKQSEFGAELDISQATVSLVEAGRMAISESLRHAIFDRFDRKGASSRLSDFLVELQRDAPPRLAQRSSTTLPVYAWSPSFDPTDEATDPAVDLITLRVASPTIALALPSATREWEADDILVFVLCEPSDCRPDDLVLLQPTKRPRNAASLIAVVERLRGRSSAHRRFTPVQPSGPALPADAESVAFVARCVYRARYTDGIPR
jgi:transcriptional regulator with XRE-family HTH domain